MVRPTARGSSLIISLCFAASSGCSQANSPDSSNPMPSAGSPGGAGAGNVSGAPSANGGAAGSAGAAQGGTPGAGAAGTPNGNAGSAGPSGGASGGTAGAASGGAGAGGAPPTAAPFAYVGSTNGQISLYKVDAAQAQLTLVKSIAGGNLTSFLAFDAAHSRLYTVNEGDAKVASFSADPKTGELTFLNRVASGGDGPAFVSVDHSGKYVLVANYDGNSTRVFPIGADGSLGAPSDDKMPGKNSHMIFTDPANKFAFVMNLGSNTVSQYAFDASKGSLTANTVPSVKVAAAGPRHMAFHPSAKFAYLISETSDTMTAYSYDAALGQLTFLQSLPTLPAGADASKNDCAEVVVAPSGNFVYGSNRGHDSIATFSINAASGMLTFVGTTPSGGKTPRSFTLSADGKLMLVANESGNVTSFSVDVTSGALTKQKSLDVPQMPQFVGLVNWGSASVQ